MYFNKKRMQFILGAFISFSLVDMAHADLLSSGTTDLNAITDSVTDITDDIEQDIFSPLEPALNQIDKKIDKRKVDLTQIQLNPVTKLSQALLDPLAGLPAQLKITDKQGKLVYTEVEVENGWRAIQFEWLLMLEPQELAIFYQLSQKADFMILEHQSFDALGMTLLRFKVKQSQDSYEKLRRILPQSIADKLDRNHIYQVQKSPNETQPDMTSTSSVGVCQHSLKIGMLDTAIELEHLAFKHANIRQQGFIADTLNAPKSHGTAVAALLVSQNPKLPALLPHAQLYAAAVFHRQNEYSQGASLFNLIKGMNWLLKKQVSVINMSLAGPDNPLLAKTIKQVIKKQVAIVAAAGNEGPTSNPLYPAAYPDVIAVTAVDKQKQVYRWANQGGYIDFAAPGVSVTTARVDASQDQFGVETGTSIAAPVVTAFVACFKQNSANYFKQLTEMAEDLGNTGKDSVFGYGLLNQN